jgi:transaldolase
MSTSGAMTKSTQQLHELGQSLWLDNITRELIDRGRLKNYIDELSVTGLTSNPTIFDHAVKNSTAYDEAICTKLKTGMAGEELFFELAIDDMTRAADLFRPIFELTNGVDGWVSLEVSPLLAHSTSSTLTAVRNLRARIDRPNLLIKIPGTAEGLPAIEEAIFAGIPINVTLLFSREQYTAAAEAYLRGIERRIAARLNPNVGSVASVFVSRWDTAVMDKVPEALAGQLGIAIARRTYKAAQTLLHSPRWQRAYNFGARPAAFVVGQHRHEESEVVRRDVRGGARGSVHREHDARNDPEGLRRPWRAWPGHARGWGQLRGCAGCLCEGRHGRGFARRAASGRRRPGIREVLERPDGRDCLEVRPFHAPGARSLSPAHERMDCGCRRLFAARPVTPKRNCSVSTTPGEFGRSRIRAASVDQAPLTRPRAAGVKLRQR